MLPVFTPLPTTPTSAAAPLFRVADDTSTSEVRLTKQIPIIKSGNVVARELYDHECDPNEADNLAAKTGHEALIEALSKQLRQSPAIP